MLVETFGAVMRRNRGVGPGFDFLRLFLALSVVLFHAFQLTAGRGFEAPAYLDPAIYFILPAFFALSGFLVAGSMARAGSVPAFLGLRALRIVPALAVEITLSALILGPAVTASPLPAYFADSAFAAYFANIAGMIHFRLPGVFLDNPIAGIVNGQLWTIPAELHCYLALGALMLLRIASRPVAMLLLFLLLAAAECATSLLPNHHYTMHVLNAQEMLVLSFLCGVVFFLWRDHIPADPRLVAAGCFVFFGCAFFAPALVFLPGAVAATYIVTFLGTRRLPRVPMLMAGDYSYGIYLYSFALQQAAIWAFPQLRTWYWNLVLALPFVLAMAALSWHWVEKPALGWRRRLVRPVPADLTLGSTPAKA